MPDFLTTFFRQDFMPHGHCFFWEPAILWLHVISDIAIGAAYYSIPVALLYLVRRRGDLAFHWMFVFFAAFIFACGTTHFVSVWTIWHGSYALEGVVKALTALISVTTSFLLWPIIPRALRLASPSALEREVELHRQAEAVLEKARDNLEEEVEARTRELRESNATLTQQTEVLERFHGVVVGRELEMVRLKAEVNELLQKLGEPQRYTAPSSAVEVIVPERA